jgi:hypothetical protein
MKPTNADQMENNGETNQWNLTEKHGHHRNDNKLDACPNAYQKHKKVKQEQEN